MTLPLLKFNNISISFLRSKVAFYFPAMLALSHCSNDKTPEFEESMDSNGENSNPDDESNTDSNATENTTNDTDPNSSESPNNSGDNIDDNKQVNQLSPSETDRLCKDFDLDFDETFSDDGLKVVCDFEAYILGLLDYFFQEDAESATKTCNASYKECIAENDITCEFSWEPDTCADRATVGMVRQCFSESLSTLQTFSKDDVLRDCDSIVWEDIDLAQEDTTPTCTDLDTLCIDEDERIPK